MYNVNIVSNYFGSELFKDIIDRMIKIYNPLEIYLFGSYAWGEPDKNSDIDLFIVVEKSDLNQADRMRIGLAELTNLNISVDLLVLTREELNAKKDHPSTLAHKVLAKGVKLYAAA